MGIRNKINTALTIWKQKGSSGLWLTVREKAIALTCTDENKVIFEVLQPSISEGVMYDVGAHHGYSLLPFAKAGWCVFAFEPDPENRKHLLENTKMYPGVYVDPRAVSDKPAQSVSFFTSTESSGISSLSAFLPSHKLACQVDITTLAEFCSEQGIDQMDFLKIDTEGFDLMVLQGVPWEKSQPKVILCEFEDAKTNKLGYSFETVADYLVSKGYQVIVSEWRPIVRYGEQHSWRGYFAYPHPLHDRNAWGNLIATNDSELYQQLQNRCKVKNRGHKPLSV